MKSIRSSLFVAAWLATALAPVALQAQQPAPAAPAAAETDNYTPSHLALARQVVLTSGIANTFDLVYPQLADQTIGIVTRTRPELRNDLIAVLKQLQPEFEGRKEEIIKATTNAFAGAMSEKDLKPVADFFASEAGKAYVAMQPKVINQMVVAMDAWNRQLSTDIMVRVREEMKKKGHQL
ncbi:MAG TPA: DUF2059 domain-containing protein [Beijerinckiaceae bacterium]|nr:DUF2059 domain-containing protein [Beijerinckiaceae bacterium]